MKYKLKRMFHRGKLHLKTRDYDWKFKIVWLVPILVSLIIIDFITKQLAFHYLSTESQREFIPGLFYLTLKFNSGVAFSQRENEIALNVFLATLILIIVTLCTVYFRKKVIIIPLGCIAAGAIGNLIDRMWNKGLVVDFIGWELFPSSWNLNTIFNLADSYVVLGCVALFIGIAIDMIMEKIQFDKDNKKDPADNLNDPDGTATLEPKKLKKEKNRILKSNKKPNQINLDKIKDSMIKKSDEKNS